MKKKIHFTREEIDVAWAALSEKQQRAFIDGTVYASVGWIMTLCVDSLRNLGYVELKGRRLTPKGMQLKVEAQRKLTPDWLGDD